MAVMGTPVSEPQAVYGHFSAPVTFLITVRSSSPAWKWHNHGSKKEELKKIYISCVLYNTVMMP